MKIALRSIFAVIEDPAFLSILLPLLDWLTHIAQKGECNLQDICVLMTLPSWLFNMMGRLTGAESM